MPPNKSLREQQSDLEMSLEVSSMSNTEKGRFLRELTAYCLAPTPISTRRNKPEQRPLSYESLGENYPADKVERYFS